MAALTLDAKIEELTSQDRRYPAEPYHFVFEALDHALTGRRSRFRPSRHIGVPELLDAIRDLALEQFGPLACCVFESWGVFATEDFGEIVFSLVDHDLLNRNECDRKEEFEGGYSFREVFEEMYTPTLRIDE